MLGAVKMNKWSTARLGFHFHDMFYFHATCDKKCVNVMLAIFDGPGTMKQ